MGEGRSVVEGRVGGFVLSRQKCKGLSTSKSEGGRNAVLLEGTSVARRVESNGSSVESQATAMGIGVMGREKRPAVSKTV